MERGLHQLPSARSPCPHCPSSVRPQVTTSSAVAATVCCAMNRFSMARHSESLLEAHQQGVIGGRRHPAA